jgi:pimeloyl-ACP methyl ester carboxylesterase
LEHENHLEKESVMHKLLKSLLMATAVFTVVSPVAAAATDKLETAPNKFVEANGVKFSYRQFGASVGTPLVFLQHFTGTNDYWDPLVVNQLAEGRPVIVFNYRGVGLSSGQVADNVHAMTEDAAAFIQALGYKQVDILGFSLGGFVAQELAAQHPGLVRKVVLAGTSNKGGGDHLLQVLGEAFSQKDSPDPRLYLFFTQSEASQRSGREFIQRSAARKERDPESGKEIADAQAKALITWANTPDPENTLLKSIKQPALIVQGSNDTMLDTANSVTLFNNISNAQLVLFPDSGHGSIFQHHAAFVNVVNQFLTQ